MTRATEHNLRAARALHDPNVDAVIEELYARQLERGWDATARAIDDAPLTWIPALFIQIVKRSKAAWRDRDAMLRAAGKAWDEK